MRVSKLALCWFFIGLVSPVLQAGNVRKVETNGETMTPIRLKMGKSTVLRFKDKPKKVVLGNSNYYSVEFIEKDIALQPQGVVETNLFVYGEKNVYGFLLSTGRSGSYDDLVQVKWKKEIKHKRIKARHAHSLAQFTEASFPNLKMSLAGRIEAVVSSVKRLKNSKFFIVDVWLKNISEQNLSMKSVDLELTRGGTPLPLQKYVLMKSKLKKGETTAARVFVKLSQIRGFSLYIKQENNKKKRVILWRKFL